MGTPKAPQSLPWTPPGASESLENELLDVENLHFSTPRLLKTQAKSLFLLVRGLRKSLFLAFKIAYKSMFFQHAFGICDFIIFYTTTHLFGLQLGPQLGVKNPSCFLIFVSWTEQTQWEPPKAPQSLLWTPWGPRENLENEPLENEILHFACPWPIENTNKKQNTQAFAEPLKTQAKNRTHKLLPHPPPRFWQKPKFYHNFFKSCRFRTLFEHSWGTLHCRQNIRISTFSPESAIFVFNLLLLRTTHLGASKAHSHNFFKSCRFWTLFERSWETLPCRQKLRIATFPRISNICIPSTASAHDASRSLHRTQTKATSCCFHIHLPWLALFTTSMLGILRKRSCKALYLRILV